MASHSTKAACNKPSQAGHAGGGSTVYVLPLTGGNPELVTEKTPSYWHGWAPNNKEVLYVAMREGSSTYNIYRKRLREVKRLLLQQQNPVNMLTAVNTLPTAIIFTITEMPQVQCRYGV
jgi:hypothetical protein